MAALNQCQAAQVRFLDFLNGDAPVENKQRGKIHILGDGRSIWDDLSKETPQEAAAIHMAGLVYPGPLSFFASCHGEIITPLREARTAYGLNRADTHSDANADYIWPITYGGSSAMFASLVCVAMGYSEIVLCGTPMNGGGHFYNPPSGRDDCSNFEGLEKNWRYAAQTYFQGKVRAVSGNLTRWLS